MLERLSPDQPSFRADVAQSPAAGWARKTWKLGEVLPARPFCKVTQHGAEARRGGGAGRLRPGTDGSVVLQKRGPSPAKPPELGKQGQADVTRMSHRCHLLCIEAVFHLCYSPRPPLSWETRGRP